MDFFVLSDAVGVFSEIQGYVTKHNYDIFMVRDYIRERQFSIKVFFMDIDFECFELGLHLEVTYACMQGFFGSGINISRRSYYQ